jgi:hypothetical protein
LLSLLFVAALLLLADLSFHRSLLSFHRSLLPLLFLADLSDHGIHPLPFFMFLASLLDPPDLLVGERW